MSYEKKNGTGAIYRNERKSQQNHPDYLGSIIDLHGVECWVSCWVNEIQNGERTGQKYFSVAIQAKQPKQSPQPAAQQPAAAAQQSSNGAAQGGFGDDLPF